MTRGRFIALEGGEGAGKSTQIDLLSHYLRGLGHEVIVTREPGGTTGAENIRALLVQGAADRWGAEAEALLMCAARADHVSRLIRPALERGAWVLCDRFIGSTLAYQGAGRGISKDKLVALHDFATQGLWPDLSIILEVDSAAGLARARTDGGEDRFENSGQDFHQRVAQGFHALTVEDPARFCAIDASGTPEQVSQKIISALAHWLSA